MNKLRYALRPIAIVLLPTAFAVIELAPRLWA
jgi:hypothetical protein